MNSFTTDSSATSNANAAWDFAFRKFQTDFSVPPRTPFTATSEVLPTAECCPADFTESKVQLFSVTSSTSLAKFSLPTISTSFCVNDNCSLSPVDAAPISRTVPVSASDLIAEAWRISLSTVAEPPLWDIIRGFPPVSYTAPTSSAPISIVPTL